MKAILWNVFHVSLDMSMSHLNACQADMSEASLAGRVFNLLKMMS